MFQFFNKNFIRILGVFRFFVLKFLYNQSFNTKGIYVVEVGSRIKAPDQGKIFMGNKAHLFPYALILSKGLISIGNSFSINRYSRIVSFEKILIGNNVTIAQFVSILDHDHAYKMINGEMRLSGYETAPISIGSNVWIGDKVTILKGVNIGNNVIIGANSLVNRDIPDNCIAVGNPARVVKSI